MYSDDERIKNIIDELNWIVGERIRMLFDRKQVGNKTLFFW